MKNGPRVILTRQGKLPRAGRDNLRIILASVGASPTFHCAAGHPAGELGRAWARRLGHAESILSIHPSIEVGRSARSVPAVMAESSAHADICALDSQTVPGPLWRRWSSRLRPEAIVVWPKVRCHAGPAS